MRTESTKSAKGSSMKARTVAGRAARSVARATGKANSNSNGKKTAARGSKRVLLSGTGTKKAARVATNLVKSAKAVAAKASGRTSSSRRASIH